MNDTTMPYLLWADTAPPMSSIQRGIEEARRNEGQEFTDDEPETQG